jgi:hypothetical protein
MPLLEERPEDVQFLLPEGLFFRGGVWCRTVLCGRIEVVVIVVRDSI